MKIKKSFFLAFKKGFTPTPSFISTQETSACCDQVLHIFLKGKKQQKLTWGFTIVELLIVIGVTAILAGMVAPVYGGLQASAQIGDVTGSLVQNLRMARQKSISGYNGTSYGVQLNKPAANQYVVYQGSDYVGRTSSYDDTVTFGSAVSISVVSGEDIHFTKGSGTTTARTITVTHVTQGSKTIAISAEGFIEEQ